MIKNTRTVCRDCPSAAHDHQKTLERVRNELPTDELLCDLSDLFKIFGDTTRTKILFSLSESEMCVCAIAELLGISEGTVKSRISRAREKLLKNLEGKI